jgi:hypothetical protein
MKVQQWAVKRLLDFYFDTDLVPTVRNFAALRAESDDTRTPRIRKDGRYWSSRSEGNERFSGVCVALVMHWDAMTGVVGYKNFLTGELTPTSFDDLVRTSGVSEARFRRELQRLIALNYVIDHRRNVKGADRRWRAAPSVYELTPAFWAALGIKAQYLDDAGMYAYQQWKRKRDEYIKARPNLVEVLPGRYGYRKDGFINPSIIPQYIEVLAKFNGFTPKQLPTLSPAEAARFGDQLARSLTEVGHADRFIERVLAGTLPQLFANDDFSAPSGGADTLH